MMARLNKAKRVHTTALPKTLILGKEPTQARILWSRDLADPTLGSKCTVTSKLRLFTDSEKTLISTRLFRLGKFLFSCGTGCRTYIINGAA
jgi:hypothetical protein